MEFQNKNLCGEGQALWGVLKIGHRISSYSASISGFILLGLMILVIADVCGRYFLKSPVPGTLEISQMLLAAVVFFSIAVVLPES